jgi:hypothetical protein
MPWQHTLTQTISDKVIQIIILLYLTIINTQNGIIFTWLTPVQSKKSYLFSSQKETDKLNTLIMLSIILPHYTRSLLERINSIQLTMDMWHQYSFSHVKMLMTQNSNHPQNQYYQRNQKFQFHLPYQRKNQLVKKEMLQSLIVHLVQNTHLLTWNSINQNNYKMLENMDINFG